MSGHTTQKEESTDEKLFKQIEQSGINLQLDIATILSNKGWECEIDKIYTDDETKISREIDIVAKKIIKTPINITARGLFNKKIVKIIHNLGFNKITTVVRLAIECKYTKDKHNWVFFSVNNTSSEKGLEFVLKRFSYPIFDKDSTLYSFTSHFNLVKKENFREKKKILVTETAQDETGNKTDLRQALHGTIKYLIFILRNSWENTQLCLIKKTTIKDKLLNFIPIKFIKKFKSAYYSCFTPLILEIYYPIVVIDGDLFYGDYSKKSVIKKDHIVIQQSYLSKYFLNKELLNKINHKGEEDEIKFYIDFVTKKIFSDFIENINKEINLITESANELFTEYSDELLCYNKNLKIYGEEYTNKLIMERRNKKNEKKHN